MQNFLHSSYIITDVNVHIITQDLRVRYVHVHSGHIAKSSIDKL